MTNKDPAVPTIDFLDRPLRLLDLFSGIGGFSLAARWTGAIKTVAFCELDGFCQQVLRKHWPEVPIRDDIRDLDATEFTPIDIVTGGFPCQPVSAAGKRRGNADARWLWPAMRRVIADSRPRWVVAENVRGLLTLGHEQVCLDLEEEGYDIGTLVLPAVSVDAPHRRERVWIVAHAASKPEPKSRHATETVGRQRDARVEFGWGSPRLVITQSGAIVADPQRERDEDDGPGTPAGTARAMQGDGHERQRLRPDAGQRDHAVGSGIVADSDESGSQGRDERRERSGEWLAWSGRRPDQAIWRVEPPVGRVANGVSRRVDRLRSLGNAIVPQVAFVILEAIVAYEQQTSAR